MRECERAGRGEPAGDRPGHLDRVRVGPGQGRQPASSTSARTQFAFARPGRSPSRDRISPASVAACNARSSAASLNRTAHPPEPGPAAPADADISALDPCTILPTSDIERVVGHLEEKPFSGGRDASEASCVFHSVRPDPGTQPPTGYFLVVAVAQRSSYQLHKQLETYQPLSGLGDDGFVEEPKAPDTEGRPARVGTHPARQDLISRWSPS